MKNWILYTVLALALSLTGCKSGFEKLRSGGDYSAQYKAALEYYQKQDYIRAQALFEAIMPQLRGKAEAEQIYFYYAYTHYYLGKFISSAYYFKQFASTFANSSLREEADYMSAYSNYLQSPTYRLEQSNTDKAIEGLQTFIDAYPSSTRVTECNKLIDELRGKLEDKAYSEAKLYFDLKYYQSAVSSYENVLKDFPETRRAEEIRFQILKAMYELAENSIYEKKMERYTNVKERCAEFLYKYPETKLKSEVLKISNDAQASITTLNSSK